MNPDEPVMKPKELGAKENENHEGDMCGDDEIGQEEHGSPDVRSV